MMDRWRGVALVCSYGDPECECPAKGGKGSYGTACPFDRQSTAGHAQCRVREIWRVTSWCPLLLLSVVDDAVSRMEGAARNIQRQKGAGWDKLGIPGAVDPAPVPVGSHSLGARRAEYVHIDGGR